MKRPPNSEANFMFPSNGQLGAEFWLEQLLESLDTIQDRRMWMPLYYIKGIQIIQGVVNENTPTEACREQTII